MAFAPDGETKYRTLLIKVDDGVIVFPVTAKGRKAAAEGVIQRVPRAGGGTRSGCGTRTPGWLRDCRCRNKYWQLKATGAVVY